MAHSSRREQDECHRLQVWKESERRAQTRSLTEAGKKTQHGSKGRARGCIIIYRTVNKRAVSVLGPIFLHIPTVCHVDRDMKKVSRIDRYITDYILTPDDRVKK